MELYGQKSSSIPQKIVIHILEIFFICLAYWILFKSGGDFVQKKLGIYNAQGATGRREIIFIFIIIAFLRLGFMMVYLLKRKIPWEESISVPMAFALYYLGFTLMALPTGKSLGIIDFIGIFIFLLGSYINTYGEILRDQWKKQPQHKGMIYTGGLFRYSRHVNYFGDLLWVSGLAILTGNGYAVFIVLFLFCFFAFYNVPKLDEYLHKKYGEGYEQWAKTTKRPIPYIY